MIMGGPVVRRGLGAMPSLTAAQYAALSPWQQQAYGNGDPNFMSATGPAGSLPSGSPSSVTTAIQALQPAVQNPQFATMPFGTSSTTTFTLDSFMAKWAAESLAFPSALQGQDPVAAALAVAQSYCATEGPPDCSNLVAIATNYGNQVKAAMPATAPPQQAPPSPGPGYVWDGTCWRPAAGGNCWGADSSVPPSPGPGYTWDGTSWRPPVSTQQSSSSGPAVVNPSPPSQPVNTGTSVTSPTSALSVANGASLQTTTDTSEIIPGIPNAVLFLGAGAVGLILLMMIGKK